MKTCWRCGEPVVSVQYFNGEREFLEHVDSAIDTDHLPWRPGVGTLVLVLVILALVAQGVFG